jgi:hypothetical protein
MSDIEVIFLCAVCGAISAAVTWKVSDRFHSGVFSEMLERLNVSEEELRGLAREMAEEAGEELDPALEPDAIHIRIEQDEDQLFAYRKDTGEFIGQGSDREALMARLISQFPQGARLQLTEEDGAAYIKE